MSTSTAISIQRIKDEDCDYEWYPTSDSMIQTIIDDMLSIETSFEINSILDCGAGDGRVLNALCKGLQDRDDYIGHIKKYAIEISTPLIDAMDDDIFIVGTDFHNQTLIDKRTGAIFVNPPFSEFDVWATKIIKQANAKFIYMILPERWSRSVSIRNALESRSATAKVIDVVDFSLGDRKARGTCNIIRVRLCSRDSWRGHTKKDPFKLWFEESFDINAASGTQTNHGFKNSVANKVRDNAKEIVKGGDFIKRLEEMYLKDMESLLNTYKGLEMIGSDLLSELNVSLDGIRESLEFKIKGLKDVYWNELFNNMDSITSRLCSSSRKKMFEVLTEHTTLDFNASNAYAIVVWAIKNANKYFDPQLSELYQRMVGRASIINYVSNKRTFGDEDWRFVQAPRGLSHFKLDYRIILERYSAIIGKGSGLCDEGCELLDDIRTIASNLGFCTRDFPKAEFIHGRDEDGKLIKWESGKRAVFYCTNLKTGKDEVLMECRAYKKGTIHLKLNQEFLLRFNVEAGRINGWLRDKREAARELDVSIEEIEPIFNSLFMLKPSSVNLLPNMSA